LVEDGGGEGIALGGWVATVGHEEGAAAADGELALPGIADGDDEQAASVAGGGVAAMAETAGHGVEVVGGAVGVALAVGPCLVEDGDGAV